MGSNVRKALSILFMSAGILFLAVGLVFWSLGSKISLDSGYQDKEPYCVVELEGAEALGKSWEGVQAEEGYTFYELSFSVRNEGDGEAYSQMPGLYFEGIGYDDVFEYYEYAEEEPEDTEQPLFYGYYEACIPPGRTGKASSIVEVRDGVGQFQASYYPGYSYEQLSFEVTLD